MLKKNKKPVKFPVLVFARCSWFWVSGYALRHLIKSGAVLSPSFSLFGGCRYV